MDFLKTLLLYMSLTLAVAVQEGPLPEDVPVPTAAPTAQVSEAELPHFELDATATPSPSPTAVPKPTITPNAQYSNIEYGDRGANVRRLQERLIELGYLPEGSADGAFGYQTNRAVRAFQSRNGLRADGVAGMSTLTRLYEDPDVIAAETPQPTQTPEATPADTASIAQPAAPEQAAPMAEVSAPPEEPADDALLVGLTLVPDGAIVLGDSGSHLVALRLSDGVMTPFYPRVWLTESGTAAVSARDMADSVGAWTLTTGADIWTLNAAGYAFTFTLGEAVQCEESGETLELPPDSLFWSGEELYLTETFLREAMHASVLWDQDENTLMLDVPDKAEALDED